MDGASRMWLAGMCLLILSYVSDGAKCSCLAGLNAQEGFAASVRVQHQLDTTLLQTLTLNTIWQSTGYSRPPVGGTMRPFKLIITAPLAACGRCRQERRVQGSGLGFKH